MPKKKKTLTCNYCGKEIEKKEATYVEGRPYCEDCVSEAETYIDDDDDDNDDDDD